MALDEDDEDEVEGGDEPAGWHEFNLDPIKPTDGTEIPFRLLANRFKSSTDASENFIHDPRTEFIKAAEEDGIEAFKDIDDTWAVSTFVVNHQRTLSFTHLYAVVAVDKNDSTVGVTLVKKGADS
jgi:hypothetical protein